MSKRRRTGDANDSPASEEETPTQSMEVWFSDGNIVLQAQNVQFKVHKSVLAKHSSVFADLFEMPHTNDEQSVDGCPVVELHDSAEDIKHVVLTIYGDKAYVNVEGALSMAVVAAMIRMGQKYDIEHVKEAGLSRLKRVFPQQLADWDRNFDEGDGLYLHTIICGPDEGMLDLAIKAIELAHECGIKSILPACYLIVCRDHTFREEDTPKIPAIALGPCALGRAELLRLQLQTMYDWPGALGAVEGCLQELECLAIGRGLMIWLWQYARLSQTFFQWERVVKSYGFLIEDLCTICSSAARRNHDEGRLDLWRDLPAAFGLHGWNHLKDFES
ncbi:hypothetical protein DFP72DRAFT_1005145 [Ephemerocybe angulata]|uniref:BTB domain-containing protein n=1 Tax=Ephemerocybe angulata TaxID=980116 RepID=A0A8H6I588_9AGAR|nr:hypothetical protein DFP72DRAFT_1005145 [Tulosesus angulatus]